MILTDEYIKRRFGGVRKMARELYVSPGAIENWKKNMPGYARKLIELYEEVQSLKQERLLQHGSSGGFRVISGQKGDGEA